MGQHAASAFKDLMILLAVFAVVIGGLYAYAGVWPPAVIVESQSMMHRGSDDVPYGRIGTIDPGDMVIVKDVTGSADVETWADSDRARYGLEGDVIVYRPGNSVVSTPIIHRAMAWVEVRGDGGQAAYHVRWDPEAACPDSAERSADGAHCVWGPDGITIQELGLIGYQPEASGFVTQGDNPFSNPRADQVSGIAEIVEPDWVQGKARGEIPWIGLIKLALAPGVNEPNPPADWWRVGNAYAPPDLWVMLGVSLFVLVGVPLVYDGWRAVSAGRSGREDAEDAPQPADSPRER